MTESTNPRETIGGNQTPDFAQIESKRLNEEYAGFRNTLEELAGEAKTKTEPTNDDGAVQIGAIIKRFRDLKERLENTRVVEVEPNLRRMNAQNAFFNGLKKLIQPEEKNERRTSPGWIDKLQGLINAYQDKKEAAARAELERERLENERIAREAQEKLERAQKEAKRLADEAQARLDEAARARAPAQVEKKIEAATEAGKASSEQSGVVAGAALEVTRAQEQVEESYIATLAKPADIVRTRGVDQHGGGVTLTKAKENYAYVTDITKLDPVKLFPYFAEAEVEKAVRAFAKATQYRTPMEGAAIGQRTKGVTR